LDKEKLAYHFSEVKRGDTASFEFLFNNMSDKVYGFSYSLLKNREEAKEVVQETFFRLWIHRHQILEEYSVQSYLFSIAKNIVISNIRKKNVRHGQKIIYGQDADENYTEKQILFQELKEQVEGLVNKLPAKRREIFILSREKGMSNKEIATHLNISVQTVNNQISSAISFVREHLDEYLATIAIIIFLS